MQGITEDEIREALQKMERELEDVIRLAEVYGQDELAEKLRKSLEETKRILAAPN